MRACAWDGVDAVVRRVLHRRARGTDVTAGPSACTLVGVARGIPVRAPAHGIAMKTTLLAPHELDPGLQLRWHALQAAQPLLGSPYFSPDFTLAVAQARPDVRVALIEDAGEVAGFFPFQRQWGIGRPVGGRLSDHHGLVAGPALDWSWTALLQGYWQFDHLAAWQRPEGVEVHQALSHGLDLSQGYEAWRQRRLADGARRLGELPRKARKLAREVGPLRFEADCRDPQVLRTVIAWKSAQCVRTGADDCFAPPWARTLVEQIAATDKPLFGGRLSALWAGDALVAAHFGMRSPRVWHWWFPVYNHDFAAYSPGALLLTEVARAAAEGGHALLDLGKGDEAYKASFADTGTAVVEGCVQRTAAITRMRHLRKSVGHWVRTAPLAQPVRPLLRRLGRLGPAAVLLPTAAMLAASVDGW
jgi:CelD/BcsL family acetyltransferase involved in cellulose biosynthesis